MAKIQLINVAKDQYFERLNYVIEKGSFLAVSGDAYRMFINVLAGLEKVDAGTYYLDYHRNETKSIHDLAAMRQEKIGYVPEDIELIEKMTALENAELPFFFQSGSNRMNSSKRQRLEQLGRLFGIHDIMRKNVSTLSDSERKCVTILRAFLNSPAIVILDEPLKYVDESFSEKITNFLRLQKNDGVTIIIGSNDEKTVAFCDEKLIINHK